MMEAWERLLVSLASGVYSNPVDDEHGHFYTSNWL